MDGMEYQKERQHADICRIVHEICNSTARGIAARMKHASPPSSSGAKGTFFHLYAYY
jgi:hypothetical protein